MQQPVTFHLRASVVPFQLLRPLPTIFACVRGVCEKSGSIQMPAKVNREFKSHIHCLSKNIEALSDITKLPLADRDDVLEKNNQLLEARANTLCERTCDLSSALERICQKHKTAIREECHAHPSLFREIYRLTVHVKKICLIFKDEITDRVSHLKETLAERCYYDVEMSSEGSFKLRAADSDLLLFAPAENPSPLYLNGIPKSRIATLLMVDFGKNLEEVSIGNLRSAFMHQRYGINVLYYPFSPIHLFQKVDTRYIEHLYQKEIEKASLI